MNLAPIGLQAPSINGMLRGIDLEAVFAQALHGISLDHRDSSVGLRLHQDSWEGASRRRHRSYQE